VETQGRRGPTGVTTSAVTDASPTAAKLLTEIAKLHSLTHTARGIPPTVCLMHPRRWSWIAGSVDSSLRPLLVPEAYDADDLAATPAGPVATLETGGLGFVRTQIP